MYHPVYSSLKTNSQGPVAVVDSHPPKEFETPAYMMSASIRHPPGIERKNSAENFIAEIAESDSRSLGYNFDSIRRLEVFNKFGGTTPANHKATDEEDFIAEIAEADSRSLGYNFDSVRRLEVFNKFGGTTPASHKATDDSSSGALRLPSLAMP